TGRSGRGGAAPAASFGAPAPAPPAPTRPAPPPARPVPGPVGRPAASRRVVDDPTELTGHAGVDDRPGVAGPRRDALLAPPSRADERDDHTDHDDAEPLIRDGVGLDERADQELVDDELVDDDLDADDLDADELDDDRDLEH